MFSRRLPMFPSSSSSRRGLALRLWTPPLSGAYSHGVRSLRHPLRARCCCMVPASSLLLRDLRQEDLLESQHIQQKYRRLFSHSANRGKFKVRAPEMSPLHRKEGYHATRKCGIFPILFVGERSLTLVRNVSRLLCTIGPKVDRPKESFFRACVEKEATRKKQHHLVKQRQRAFPGHALARRSETGESCCGEADQERDAVLALGPIAG